MAVIQNIISTVFNSQNAANTIRDLTNVNKNITRLGQTSASAGRAFSAQASGLGGLVAAYAGAAATTFALQQAFDALARSARAAQTLEGLKSLATASGESSAILLKNVREITKNQLTLTEAAQQINLSLSAGFNTDQIERLGGVALKASRALGRDLTDAYTRVVRGSAKLETELLDELGIYTRIDPAVRAYADANNRAANSLTDFERRQAFVNAVIAEGERKFRAINTTVPTTAEKIEAFGTRIIDIATQIGIFVADRVAPLAEFLTNNLAASFGTVGLAAGLMAATLKRVTQEALVRFQERAATMAISINQSILGLTSGFNNLQNTAQTAIAGVSLANKGLINGIGQELKALKDVAQQRRLNTVELQQAQGLLNKRLDRLRELRRSELTQIRDLRAQRTAAAAAGQSTSTFNKELAGVNNRLKTTRTLIASTTAQLNAVTAASNAGSASLARFASGVVSLSALGVAGIARLGVGFVGLGGFILSAVSIVSLLTGGIAKLIGKQEEFNAVTRNLGAGIASFFNKDEIKDYNNVFLSTTASAIEEAEQANDTLKELDTFKIRSKIVGIDIVIEKTKEDLVKEVASILTTVATESEKTFGASLADSITSVFAIIGGLLGTLIPGIGNVAGFIVGGSVGTVIGAIVDQLSTDLPPLTDELTKKLITDIAKVRLDLSEQEAIALFDDANLSAALKILDDQVGITKDLSFAGRLAYETQVQLLIAQAKNIDNARVLNQLVSNTGLSAAEISKKFGFEEIDNFITKISTKKLPVEVEFKILNEELILKTIDDLANDIDAKLATINSTPYLMAEYNVISEEDKQKILEIEQNIRTLNKTIDATKFRMAEMQAGGVTTEAPGYQDAAAELANYNAQLDNYKQQRSEILANVDPLLGSLASIGENFRTLGSSTVSASNSILLATNSLSDLQSSIESGSLTLENYSQALANIDKNIDRFRASSERANISAEELKPVITSIQEELGKLEESDPLRAPLQQVLQIYNKLSSALQENSTELLQLENAREAVLANAAGIKAQLELSKQLKSSFGSILTQNVDLLNIFTTQGDIIASNADRQTSRDQFLQGVISSNNTALENRRNLQQAINAAGNVDATLAQQILSTSEETYDVFLNTLSVQSQSVAKQFKSYALTSDQLVAYQNVQDALAIQQNLFLNSLESLIQITAEINAQNDALQQRIGILQAQNAVAAAQRNLSKIQLDNTIARNAAQLTIRKEQANLTALQISENKAGGSGLDIKKQSLELLKAEIELRQGLSDIEAEATKRRLQDNLEAAQKTKEAFGEASTPADLTAALTGIGAILANQLQLIELDRQQAEEKYQNTLETLAIERQLLEAELSAASGAQKASEEQITKQLEILDKEQQLERDAVDNSIKELNARKDLLVAQQRLQIAEAKAEAAKARADVSALRAQGEQNLSFLNNKADLDDSFLEKMAELITKFARAADPSAATITVDKVSRNFKEASSSFEAAISDLERSTDTLYGRTINTPAGPQQVGGLVFEAISDNFIDSISAINTEIKSLNTRKTELNDILTLERQNAEAQLRAQQSGGASRLAELETQLKAIELKEAQAVAERGKLLEEANKKQADAVRQFALDVVETIGNFIVKRKQQKLNALLEEEEQIKDILAFQTESLTEAQNAASSALEEEISLREKLKDATESLIESQTSYLESIAGQDGTNIVETSKQFIDTLLEQKQVIFDLQRATRSRIAADGRVASLETAQAQLQDALSLKTAQRIEAEESLKKTQERLALVTKLVSGEIGNFINSLGSLGNALAGLSGGGSLGQVFSNLFGIQNIISGFSSLGETFAAAAGTQLAAANTQAVAANTLANTASGLAPLSSPRPMARPTAVGVGVTGQSATASALTFSGFVSSALSGAGVGAIVGAITGDETLASTIGGAVGGALAYTFASSAFVSGVSAGIAGLATSAGFTAATSATIAAIATPLAFAAIGALIIGAIFGGKKKRPEALIEGTLTGEGFEASVPSYRKLSEGNVKALKSIPEQVFDSFLSSFEEAGLKFRDKVDVSIKFYNGQFERVSTSFAEGITITTTNIGKSAQDLAKELERQFFRALGPESFKVDQFTFAADRIQQALNTFGQLEDLDEKTRERFIEGIEYAREFDNIVRNFLGTSVQLTDIFRIIDSAASSFAETTLFQYTFQLGQAAKFLGESSEEYDLLEKSIRSNALSLLGLAEAADGSLVSVRELASELNAGAIAIRNIVAETVAIRSTLEGLGTLFDDLDIDEAIFTGLGIKLQQFVGDFGDSLTLAIEVLRDPAKLVLVDLEKFIVNGTARIEQATGIYNQLLEEQANSIEFVNTELVNITKSISEEAFSTTKSIASSVKEVFGLLNEEFSGLVTYDNELGVATVQGEVTTTQVLDIPIESFGVLDTALDNISKSTELLTLELESFISTISDKGQLQAIIDGAEAIDDYAGAIAKSAAEARLAEINEIERTQATKQFNTVSREFTNRLREITGAAGGLTIGGSGASLIDVLEAFGTSNVDDATKQFKDYLDLINSGVDISDNFNSAIDFLNERFDNGETNSLNFVSALELLQRVTLETIDSIEQLTTAYENTLEQISTAFKTARGDLIDSISNLSDELVGLIEGVSDRTQEILGIYDDAVSSVAESGSAIFDLRDAADEAFESATEALKAFEEANNLSGRTSAEIQAELDSIAIQLADSLSSQTIDVSTFLDYNSLLSRQRGLRSELSRLTEAESEYQKLREDQTRASEDLAFVEGEIAKLGNSLVDTRSTESEIIQDTRAAIEDYTKAQATLAEVTDILAERGFDLTQTRIDETDAVIKLNTALRELDRSSMSLDVLVNDILASSDSTLRQAFIDGAISNIADELSTLDEAARNSRIAEVAEAAGSAFDMLIPLATAIRNIGDRDTANSMSAVSDATNLTTDTFEELLNIFNPSTISPVSSLVSEISRIGGIGLEIANLSEFSAKLLDLGNQTGPTATEVANLVSDLNALEEEINTLTGDSGVDSLRTVFTNLAEDLQKAWDENVVLGLPDVINLSAITIAEDGGLSQLNTIADNSGKFAYIGAVGIEGMKKDGRFKEGGYVSGPGTSTSDSISAQLSNGEFVIKASTVSKLGVGLLNSLNSSGDLNSVIASQGRFGDTIAAHITAQEAIMLKKYGGSGTRNPVTGMLEFFAGANSGASAFGGLFRDQEAALLYNAYKTRFATDKAVEAQNSKGYASVNDTNTYMTAKIDKLFNADKRDEPIEVTAFAPAVGNPGSQNRFSLASAELFGNMLADNYGATAQMMAVRGLDQSSINIGENIIATEKSSKRSTVLGLGDKPNTALPAGNKNFKGVADSSLKTFSGMQRIGSAQYGDGSITLQAMRDAVSAQNQLNSMFFDFYMLKDSYNRIPKNVKASQGALKEASRISDGEGDYFTTDGFGIDYDGDRISDAYYSETRDRYGNVVSSSIRESNSFDRGVERVGNAISDAWNDFKDSFSNAGGGLVTRSGALNSIRNSAGARDSINTMLQPGEFVLRKPAVDRMGVDAAVRLNSTGNVDSDVNVEVNVINNSSPVTPTIQQTRRENGKIVVDVILEDVRNNGPIRQALKGVR